MLYVTGLQGLVFLSPQRRKDSKKK